MKELHVQLDLSVLIPLLMQVEECFDPFNERIACIVRFECFDLFADKSIGVLLSLY